MATPSLGSSVVEDGSSNNKDNSSNNQESSSSNQESSSSNKESSSNKDSPNNNKAGFIPLVTVVDFHHHRGPEVERWFGAAEGQDPAADYDWTLLPFMALSDGAHA